MSNTSASERAALARVATIAALLLAALALAPMLALALIHGSLPNVIESPFGQVLNLFPGLFGSNPAAALRILVSQPLAVIVHVEAGSGLRVWEVYLHLWSLLFLFAVALNASLQMRRGLTGEAQIVPLAGGLALIALALNTIRVAACCTSPGWGPDVWLRGLALSPPLGGVDWGMVYPQIERFILPMQILIGGAGTGLVLIAGQDRDWTDPVASHEGREHT